MGYDDLGRRQNLPILGFQLGLFIEETESQEKNKPFINVCSAHHTGETYTKSDSKQRINISVYTESSTKNNTQTFVEK